MSLLRILVAVAVTALSAGIPQAVMAALDDDCCTEPCGGPDGRCPPNCRTGSCTEGQSSLGAVVAPSVGPQAMGPRAVVVAERAPRLPLGVTGPFHPPRA